MGIFADDGRKNIKCFVSSCSYLNDYFPGRVQEMKQILYLKTREKRRCVSERGETAISGME